MSNKLIKTRTQLERDNGHATNGHAERTRPSFRTNNGYRVYFRYLSPDTLPRLDAAARTALDKDKPPIPTQRLEVGPNEWRDQENPHDEQYQEALEQWELKVQGDAGGRFLRLCEDYALIYEIDMEEVNALKAVHRAIDDPLDDLSDKHIFLWRIALPTPEDQMMLYGKLFGGLTEEAIEAQKATFRSNLQAALTSARA